MNTYTAVTVTTVRVDVKLTKLQVLTAVYELNQNSQLLGIEQIVRHSECSEKTVRRHLKMLKTDNLIAYEDGSGRRKKRYVITERGLSEIQKKNRFVNV